MTNTQTRKADHLRICLEDDVQFDRLTTGLDKYRFTHSCLPELNFQEIDLSTQFLGKTLTAPLLISSMTGGTERAKMINSRLATAAQKHGLAMGVGSQRIAVENPKVAHTFAMRSFAPDALLLANLGAVQLNYTYGLEQCLRVVEILEADALILHLNPLQECIQPNGDRNFKGLLDKIAQLCQQLDVPVIAKEVGNGISVQMATKLDRGRSLGDRRSGCGRNILGKSRGRKSRKRTSATLGTNLCRLGHTYCRMYCSNSSDSSKITPNCFGWFEKRSRSGKNDRSGSRFRRIRFSFPQGSIRIVSRN